MGTIEKCVYELLDEGTGKIAVRKAGSYRFPSSYRYEAHAHVEYEINYVSSGRCVMTFEEEYVPLKDGECIIISPFAKHGFLVDAKCGCNIRQAELSIEIPEKMRNTFPFSRKNHPYYKIRDCEDITSLIEQIAKVHRNEENEYRKILLELSVVQLMVALGYHTNKNEDATIGIKNKKLLKS